MRSIVNGVITNIADHQSLRQHLTNINFVLSKFFTSPHFT